MKKTCIIRGCKNPIRARGLCTGCHAAALALVRGRQTTWEELEELNLAVSKRQSLFMAEWERVKKKSGKPPKGRGRQKKVTTDVTNEGIPEETNSDGTR
jgi:hypothetical protein